MTDRKEGDRIIKRQAMAASRSAGDVALKMRAAMKEGVGCVQTGWLFAGISGDLERLS